MRIAAIDIGSNAARLLIKEVNIYPNNPAEFTKLNLLRIPLRLGFDVFKKGKIEDERLQMLMDSMKIFRKLMDLYKVDHYRACATSAMRDAENGQEIIQKVKDNCQIDIEIISGDEEALLIYDNHAEEFLSKDKTYLYIDVGGGSTELSLYHHHQLQFEQSFNVGTIRLLDGLVCGETWDEMKRVIKDQLSENNIIAIGSGGNINKIFTMSKIKESKSMSLQSLKNYHKDLSALSVEERMRKYKLREDRADVLVPALQIYIQIMQWTKIKEIYVPKISVADGLIKNIYEKLTQN